MQKLDGHWVAKRVGILDHYKGMTLAEIVLFDAYLLLANKQTWECWATIEQMEEVLPMARRTILYAKKRLMERGWIERAGKSGVFIPKLFRYADKVQNEHSKVQEVHFPYPGDLPAKVQNSHRKVHQMHHGVQNSHSKVQDMHHIIEEENIIEDDILLLGSAASEIPETGNPPESTLPHQAPDTARKMSQDDRRYLHLLKSIPDYPFSFEKDLPFIRDLLVDFPGLDLGKEIKDWKTWLLDRKLNGKINYRSRLRRWLTNSTRYKEEQRHGRGLHGGSQPEAHGEKRGRKGFDLPSDYPVDAGGELDEEGEGKGGGHGPIQAG